MKVVANLTVGLGNQIFQYAAAFAYAKKVGASLHYDSSTSLGCPQENNDIKKLFRLSASEFNPPRKLSNWYYFFNRRILAYIRSLNLLKYMSKEIFVEDSYAYSQLQIKEKNSDLVYLVGYYQAAAYFLEYEDALKSDLDFRAPISKKAEPLRNAIISSNSVSIHVRRGDYLTTSASKVHGVCDVGYYYSAISYVREKVKDPVFYIFSDDIKWCVENLKLPNGTVFSDLNSDLFDDFQLISLCKSNIIANSSFSWWAAFLNKNEEKTVIAPSKWFNDIRLNSLAEKQLYLDEWIKI